MDYKKLYKSMRRLSDELYPGYINKEKNRAYGTIAALVDKTDEKYRYTSMSEFFKGDYNPYELMNRTNALDVDLPKVDSAVELYFVNGMCVGCSDVCSDSGITYCGLNVAADKYADTVAKYYNRLTDAADFPTALNTATATPGLYIDVEKYAASGKTIVITDITDSKIPIFTQYRNMFVFRQGCVAEVIVHTVGNGKVSTLSNTVSEIILERNAKVRFTRITDTDSLSRHVSSDYVRQAGGSEFSSVNITLNCGQLRRNTVTLLGGETATCNLAGFVFAGKQQHVDNYTFVDHAVASCKSDEIYKSIACNKAVNIFNGRVLVRQDAQKTEAYQLSKNLLMSSEAKIQSKPQLEICADDVVCSHGATTGQLDENTVFYMQSRGINRKIAQMLISEGFAADIFARVENRAYNDFLVRKLQKVMNLVW